MAVNFDTRDCSLRAFRPAHFDGLVRVGRDYDGGYVVLPDLIVRSEALLSLGVNVDWSFEEGVLEYNSAIRLTCVDRTTGMNRAMVKAAQKTVDMVGHFASLQIEKGLRDAKYLKMPLEFHRFFSQHELLRLMVAKDSAVDCVTLPMLLTRVTEGRCDCWVFLKIDIEGVEFEVLPASIDLLTHISTLIVEFHRVDLQWERFLACMTQLMQIFHIAHVHGNNFDGYVPGTQVPATLEMTLVNKQLVAGVPPPSARSYPLADLDMPCNWKRPDLAIGFD
jgi:Methyltransferase FkbM domain